MDGQVGCPQTSNILQKSLFISNCFLEFAFSKWMLIFHCSFPDVEIERTQRTVFIFLEKKKNLNFLLLLKIERLSTEKKELELESVALQLIQELRAQCAHKVFWMFRCWVMPHWHNSPTVRWVFLCWHEVVYEWRVGSQPWCKGDLHPSKLFCSEGSDFWSVPVVPTEEATQEH